MILRRIAEALKRQDWAVVCIELLVVVAGLAIGLRVDDWNERRKQSENFYEVLERVYTDIKKEHFLLNKELEEYQAQAQTIQTLLENPDSIPDEKLIFVVYYQDLPLNWSRVSGSQIAIERQIDLLADNANTPRQLLVVKQLIDYASEETAARQTMEENPQYRGWLLPVLHEAGIVDPNMVWLMSALNNFEGGRAISMYEYTEEDIRVMRELLEDESFRTRLWSLVARKSSFNSYTYNRQEAAGAALQRLKAEFPDLRLLFHDLEIIGSAVDPDDEFWQNSNHPMEPVPGYENRWTLDIQLHEGGLKFRTRQNWDENWGGRTFPEGSLSWFGDNIMVPAGHYRITLDLVDETYSFQRLDAEAANP